MFERRCRRGDRYGGGDGAVPAPAGTYYPGLRRLIDERDDAALAYVEQTLEACAPFIGGGFDVDGVRPDRGELLDGHRRARDARPRRSARRISIRPIPIISRCSIICSDTPRHRLLPPALDRDRDGRRRAMSTRFVAAAQARERGASAGYIQRIERAFRADRRRSRAVRDRLVIYQGRAAPFGHHPAGMTSQRRSARRAADRQYLHPGIAT